MPGLFRADKALCALSQRKFQGLIDPAWHTAGQRCAGKGRPWVTHSGSTGRSNRASGFEGNDRVNENDEQFPLFGAQNVERTRRIRSGIDPGPTALSTRARAISQPRRQPATPPSERSFPAPRPGSRDRNRRGGAAHERAKTSPRRRWDDLVPPPGVPRWALR